MLCVSREEVSVLKFNYGHWIVKPHPQLFGLWTGIYSGDPYRTLHKECMKYYQIIELKQDHVVTEEWCAKLVDGELKRDKKTGKKVKYTVSGLIIPDQQEAINLFLSIEGKRNLYFHSQHDQDNF